MMMVVVLTPPDEACLGGGGLALGGGFNFALAWGIRTGSGDGEGEGLRGGGDGDRTFAGGGGDGNTGGGGSKGGGDATGVIEGERIGTEGVVMNMFWDGTRGAGVVGVATDPPPGCCTIACGFVASSAPRPGLAGVWAGGALIGVGLSPNGSPPATIKSKAGSVDEAKWVEVD